MTKLLKSVKKGIFKWVPERFKVPFYYYVMQSMGRLERELLHLDQLLKECGTALDIGANRGLYTFYLSKKCLKVIAFEPQAELANRLRAMRCSNVEVHEVGLSNIKEKKLLYVPESNGHLLDGLASLTEKKGATEFVINLVPLDTYGLTDVTFIKIDVEGHEWEVIDGAKNTIKTNRPILLVEIEQRHLKEKNVVDIFTDIEQMGYNGFFLSDHGKLVSVREFSYEKHQQPYLENPFDPRYVNNFYFFPRQPTHG